MRRKAAETELPIIPPILLKRPNLELIAEAVAATMMEVMMTMLEVVQGVSHCALSQVFGSYSSSQE